MGAKKRIPLNSKAKPIRLILCDVDGVMTDGGLYYAADGTELKRFDAQDGYGIRLAQRAGIAVGIISGRTVPSVVNRARELDITEVHQGARDKLEVFQSILARTGLRSSEVAYIGDDTFDIPLLKAVGLACAPNNARPEVKESVHHITKAQGGHGAVREVIDFVLAAKST